MDNPLTIYEEIHQRYGNAADFCDRVKRTLSQRNVPMSDLAGFAGIDPRELYRWLGHRRTPRLENMLLVDEALENLLAHLDNQKQEELDL